MRVFTLLTRDKINVNKSMNESKNQMLKMCLLVIFALLTCDTLRGQANDNAVDKRTDEQIDKLFSGYHQTTPGVAVAVVKDGKIIFKKGYGMANLEYDLPITSKSVFHVASVSKQFTAFSIFLLEKQGKISFEDDVRKYVPEVPNFGKTIRIKHLLAHTSGLKDQWALLTLAGWRLDDVITTEHILKIIGRQKELNFEPGSQFLYSNSGYTLLAEIVARVSGQSFAAYTKKNIFEPLGMTDTQFYDDFGKIVRNRVYSYELVGDTYQKKNLNYSNVGATGLFTTVEDLSKWALNFENPIVGDAELIKRFNEPALLDDGQPAVYAVVDDETIYPAKGQFVRNYRGLNLYNHTGGDAGFRTYLARFPDKKFSVIVLSNDYAFQSLKSGLEVAEVYLKDDLKKKAVQPAAAVRQNKNNAPVNFNPVLKDFEGEFASEELPAVYSLKARDGKLIASHSRLSDVELVEVGKNKFSGKIWFAVELEFMRDKNDRVTGFKVSNFGAKNVNFNKVR